MRDRLRTGFCILAGVAALGGCATTERLAAANDVHGLMVAIRNDDLAAFDAHIDRPALEAEIQAIVVSRAQQANLGDGATTLGLLLSGPISRAAGGILLKPDVFRAVAEAYGYRADQPLPGSFAIAAALSALPDGRVCARVRRGGRCVMTFQDEGGVWKLVSVDAAILRKGAK